MRLLLATTNRDKLREIRSLLADAPVDLIALSDVAPVVEPEETGETFRENARLKARYYAAHSGMLTVAEDSGLVIDALDGEPGVRSAQISSSRCVVPGTIRGDLRAARPPSRAATDGSLRVRADCG